MRTRGAGSSGRAGRSQQSTQSQTDQEQEPSVGPPKVPALQRSTSSHQPHPLAAMQVLQVV